MVNNSTLAALALALSIAGVGCGRAQAGDAAGYQGVVEQDEALLGFDLGGRVASVGVARGQPIAKGAELARLDDALARASRDARRLEVEAARAQVALVRAGARAEDVASLRSQARGARASEAALEKEVERVRSLVASGSVPAAALDDVEARLSRVRSERESLDARARGVATGARPEEIAVAEARVKAAEAAVALEDERLTRHALRAPTGGVVADVHVKAGEVVGPGAAAVTVTDPAHPFVDVFVPEGSLEGVHVGVKAAVRVDAIGRPFEGQVEHVSTKTEFTPRYLFSDKERPNLVVRVRVRVDDPRAELHAGVPARVRIERSGGGAP